MSGMRGGWLVGLAVAAMLAPVSNVKTSAAARPVSTASPLLWGTLAPALFVVLWATGFIGAKAGLPYAEPFTFVALRYAFVVALMLPLALISRAQWPSRWIDAGHQAVVGLLMHGMYIAGVFASIYHGLGEHVRPRQWFGLLLGLIGVGMVLANKLALDSATGGAVLLALGALLGITLGTIYQKRFCGEADLRSGAVIQFAAAGLACLALALTFETMRIVWAAPFVWALAYLALVLSIGTVSLLYMLLRRGAAAKIASLFYLVPPVTALMAWLFFGEVLGPLALAGMVVTAVGVALVQRG
jgi:drug/metabolite transporter (DMT)-like permease